MFKFKSGIFEPKTYEKIIKDTFFGGAEKKAAKQQQAGIEKGLKANEKAIAQAREDIFKLYPAAQQNAQMGFQGAMDIFGQTIPQQGQVFQAGNIGAQEQLLQGLGLSQNALLGGQVDLSQLQPTRINADFGFAQQQLPQYIDPYAPPAPTTPAGVPDVGNPDFTGPVINPEQHANLLGGQMGSGQMIGPANLLGYQQANSRF